MLSGLRTRLCDIRADTAFVFPVRAGTVGSVAVESASAGRLRVVLVDDFVPVRVLVAERLSRVGCAIAGEVGNGRLALELLDQVACDLVVMDFHMPVMNGLDATRAIAERHPTVEVVAYTSTDDPEMSRAFLEAGASRHFDKADAAGLIDYVAGRARVLR